MLASRMYTSSTYMLLYAFVFVEIFSPLFRFCFNVQTSYYALVTISNSSPSYISSTVFPFCLFILVYMCVLMDFILVHIWHFTNFVFFLHNSCYIARILYIKSEDHSIQRQAVIHVFIPPSHLVVRLNTLDFSTLIAFTLRDIYAKWFHVKPRYMPKLRRMYGFLVGMASTYDDAHVVLCYYAEIEQRNYKRLLQRNR